jgi:DNA replication protein DnaC
MMTLKRPSIGRGHPRNPPRYVLRAEAGLRKLISHAVLMLDDFGLDSVDHQEGRVFYDIINERHRAGSMILTSNRDPDEWLATFPDPLRTQSAIDRLQNSALCFGTESEADSLDSANVASIEHVKVP